MSRSVRDNLDTLRERQARAQVSIVTADPIPNCPTRIMDGRNELRCWFLKGHEGDCK